MSKPAAAVSLRERIASQRDVLLAPPLYIILIFLVALPLGFLAWGALQTGSPGSPTSEFTWEHVTALFTEGKYRIALVNTLVLAGLVTLVSIVFGTAFAWLVARTDIPGKKAFELLVPLPLFLSPFAGAVAWVILGSPSAGTLNVIFRAITGSSEGFMNVMTFPGLVFVMSLFFIPYSYLFTIAPLQNMDGSLEEASRVAGATLRRTMLRISLPVILPGALSAALMVFVLSAEMFSIPGLIGTAAGYPTLPYLIYQSTHFSPPNWGGAAAAGLLLLLIMVVGLALQRRATRASKRFVTVTGKGSKPSLIHLGRWRWIAFLFPAAYTLLAMILPWGSLILGSFMQYFTTRITPDLFTLRHWERVLGSNAFQGALGNSVLVGLIGPTVAIVFGYLLAYIWNRTRAPLRRSTETLAMLPVAVPGIVFGVGILWAYVQSPLYGTIWLLIVAYTTRFLSHPVRMFSSTIVQIDGSLEEASRVGGAGMFRTMRSISAPLLKNAALSAWLLLVIMFLRELNVAIMVYTSSSNVLPVLMWGETEGGSFQGAAVVALVESAIILAIFLAARWLLGVDLVKDRAPESN